MTLRTSSGSMVWHRPSLRHWLIISLNQLKSQTFVQAFLDRFSIVGDCSFWREWYMLLFMSFTVSFIFYHLFSLTVSYYMAISEQSDQKLKHLHSSVLFSSLVYFLSCLACFWSCLTRLLFLVTRQVFHIFCFILSSCTSTVSFLAVIALVTSVSPAISWNRLFSSPCAISAWGQHPAFQQMSNT